MLDSEIIRFIREEIRKAANVLLAAETGVTTEATESIQNLFPGSPTIDTRPVMHPYGVSSRAPRGTISVVGRHGDHLGNRFVMGHRDKNRPTLAEGETILYNSTGQQVKLINGQVQVISPIIKLGSASSAEKLVLGLQLKALLEDILDELMSQATDISTHMHPTAAPGAPSPPVTAAAFVAHGTAFTGFKTSEVSSGNILSDKAFTEK